MEVSAIDGSVKGNDGAGDGDLVSPDGVSAVSMRASDLPLSHTFSPVPLRSSNLALFDTGPDDDVSSSTLPTARRFLEAIVGAMTAAMAECAASRKKSRMLESDS